MMEHGKGKGHRRLQEVYDTSDAVILGEGMSGRVATCRQRYSGELFALKTLSVAKLKVDMDELRQEIDILRRLDHPNIVKVYETFEEEGLFHVVMELCCGGQVETRHAPLLTSPHRTAPHRTPRHVTAPCEPPHAHPRTLQLISRLKSHKRGFGEEMAARLMSKMIASILYCHERNVCHRDVKLDNFVYESDGEDAELKLIDFGLSHVLLHTQEKMHDRVGMPRPVRERRPADLCHCPVGLPGGPQGHGPQGHGPRRPPHPAAFALPLALPVREGGRPGQRAGLLQTCRPAGASPQLQVCRSAAGLQV